MFTAKLMNDTPIEIFIDNGATVVLLHCGCLSLIPFNPFNEFMNLEFGTTHQVQVC